LGEGWGEGFAALTKLIVLSTLLLIANGCTQPTETDVKTNATTISPISNHPDTDTEALVEPPEEEPKIKAAVMSIARTDQLIASFKGKIVVVDLWALW
jgi:hypothetical protein